MATSARPPTADRSEAVRKAAMRRRTAIRAARTGAQPNAAQPQAVQAPRKVVSTPPKARVAAPPPKRPKAGAILGSIVALIIIMFLFSTPIGGIFFNMAKYPYISQFPDRASFEVMRVISIESSGGSFTIDLPKAPVITIEGGGLAQNVRSSSTVPTAGETKMYNNWTWMTWSKYVSGTSDFSVDYVVETKTLRWDLQASDSGTVSQIPQNLKDQYLGREWLGDNFRYKIDPQNKVLQDKAIEVSKDVPTVFEKLEKIYFFLQGAYKYEQGSTGQEPKDALTTYETKAGDCDEVSFLLISMLRSLGIPAWTEFGILYDEMRQVWVGHAWVQMHIPLAGGGWYYVNLDPVNYQFLFRSANRLTEWVEDGNGAHLEEFYNYITYTSTTTPKITGKIESMAYSTEGTVFMQDRSREIKYVDAPGTIELVAAIAAASITMAFVARSRCR